MEYPGRDSESAFHQLGGLEGRSSRDGNGVAGMDIEFPGRGNEPVSHQLGGLKSAVSRAPTDDSFYRILRTSNVVS